MIPAEIVRREGVAKGTAADSREDVIKVVVDGEAVGVLREGMGLFGVWVRVNEMPIEENGNKENGEKMGKEGKEGGAGKKKKKRGPKKADEGSDKVFWYTEKVFEVMPSFWTEPKGDEIVEGP